MHKRSHRNQNLSLFDPEIEAATRHRCSEARRRKEATAVMVEREKRVLQDYALPQASSITSSIISPMIEADNFKLNPALITFMERDQLGDILQITPTCTFANSL